MAAELSNGHTRSKPEWMVPGREVGDFDTSPAELARRIIRRNGAELLIVDDRDYGTGYALDAKTGLWHAGGDIWVRWLVEIADEMHANLIQAGLIGRPLGQAANQVHRLKRPGMVEQVRPMLRAMLEYLRARGEHCSDVTECKAEEIDTKLRYLGAANGVVDLHSGELLDPQQGRKALVTVAVPVDFDPSATHPDVDRLFAHLPEESAQWWWKVLGYHLRGAPSGRVYLVKGPPYGGKSTLIEALCATLGPYASKPAGGVLEDRRSRQESETQLTPGMEAFVPPRRLALMDEVKARRINNRLVKDLSGDGSVTWRGLHRDLRTDPATATMMMFCNDGSEPRLRLEDAGMRRRYRELPYPEIPEHLRDASFIGERIRSPDFQRALFARLVAEAAKAKPGAPPEDVPTVTEATHERIRGDVGEIVRFARRIVRSGGAHVTVSEAWIAWCKHNGVPIKATTVGGITRRSLGAALRDHVSGLPASKSYTVAGKSMRGWRGWQLLSVADAAALATPAAKMAERAINELLEAFSDLTAEEREQWRRELHHVVMQPAQLRVIDQVYGPDVEHRLRRVFPQAYGPNGEPLPRPIDEWRKEGYTDEQAAKLQDVQGIASLVMFAEIQLDATRPVSPALQQVRDRYHAIPIVTMGREDRALNYLGLADQELGVDATVEDLLAKAVALAKDDAVSFVNGRPAKTKLVIADPPKLSAEEARCFEDDLVADIKKLCGLPVGSQ